MLSIKVIQKEDIADVANLIAQLNNREESHIGYCGMDKEEIVSDMVNELTDVPYTESFIGAFEKNQLVGVVGFDADFETGSAEIWGPFIQPNKWGYALYMWDKMTELLPEEINSLQLFPNVKNHLVQELAQKLTFQKDSDETILVFERNQIQQIKSSPLKELTQENHEKMIKLHEVAFPGAYFSGQQIIDRLNEQRKVFIINNKANLSGYIYVEAEPDFGGASIEFFAVNQSERGRGIGGQLLTGAIQWLFSFKEIDSIRLCVNSSNTNAIKLYQKVGFQQLHNLYVFTKNLSRKKL